MKTAFVRLCLLLLVCAPLCAPASAATLRIGSDISYAPLEFYAPHSKQVEGFDYDLAQAVAAQMGDHLAFVNHSFDNLIPSLNGGKFQAVMSAMSDTRQRAAQVDFIDYFLAGSGILVPANNPHHIYNLASLCGLTVDLQAGTSQQLDVAQASKTCTSLGLRPIRVLAYGTDDEALKQFLAHKSDAHISDYPVVAYLSRTLDNGKEYVVIGRQFGVVPYGIAVSKKNPQLRDRIQSALKAVIASGTYDKLLAKWGLQQGAMRSASINAGTKFQ